jgi:hypothetical protein
MQYYVGQTASTTLQVTVPTERGVLSADADAIPTVEVLDDSGAVVATYTDVTADAVTKTADTTGKYSLEFTAPTTAGEYTIRWTYDYQTVTYISETDVEVLGPSASADVGSPGMCELVGRVYRLDGSPAAFEAVECSIDLDPYMSTFVPEGLVAGNVTAVTSRDGTFRITLPHCVEVVATFPRGGYEYSFTVPAESDANFFDYATPRPVSFHWCEHDPDDPDATTDLVLDGGGILNVVAGDTTSVGIYVLWSDGTRARVAVNHATDAEVGGPFAVTDNSTYLEITPAAAGSITVAHSAEEDEVSLYSLADYSPDPINYLVPVGDHLLAEADDLLIVAV